MGWVWLSVRNVPRRFNRGPCWSTEQGCALTAESKLYSKLFIMRQNIFMDLLSTGFVFYETKYIHRFITTIIIMRLSKRKAIASLDIIKGLIKKFE